jgi:hypothetical protein
VRDRFVALYVVVKRAEDPQVLDLFAGESCRRVYAGELEVRPPGAPTTEPVRVMLERR